MARGKDKARAKWSEIKRALKDWGQPGLMGLIRELFEFSGENRAFLAARLLNDSGETAPIEAYRRRVTEAFYPAKSRFPKGDPKLAEARKAIRDYEKASGDMPGALDLMLAYVETGTDFTRDFGDMYEGYYDSLCSVLGEFLRRLASPEGRQFKEQFRERLVALADNAKGIGWGYGDYVCERVGKLTGRA